VAIEIIYAKVMVFKNNKFENYSIIIYAFCPTVCALTNGAIFSDLG